MADSIEAELEKRIAQIQSMEAGIPRAEALASVAEEIDPDSPLIDQVLDLVLFSDPAYGARAKAYHALLPKLRPEQLQHALSTVPKRENEKVQAEELGFLAPHLPPEARILALEIASRIRYEAARGHALEVIFPHLAEPERQKAMAFVASFESPARRIYTTMALLKHMPQNTRPILDDLMGLSESVSDPKVQTHIFYQLASHLDQAGDHEKSRALLSRSEELAQSIQDSRLQGRVKTAWGRHYRQTGDFSAAREAFDQALEMTTEPDERAGLLNLLGLTLRDLDDPEQALGVFSESVELNQQAGNLAAEYQAQKNLAGIYDRMGLRQEAEAARQRLSELARTLEEKGLPVEEEMDRYADFNLATRFVPDIPTAEDALHFEPLVKALGDMLNDPKTDLPLAVALTAPWGGGKSSLMKQLDQYLTNAEKTVKERNWQTVWFDAWKYETNEQVWASLAKLIYDYAQDSKSGWRRLLFRLRLERRRGKLGRDLAMTLLTVLGGALAGFIGSRWADLSQAFPVLTAGGVLVAAAGFFSRYGTDLWQPFKRAMDRHAQLKTKYSQRQGFTAEANQDIGHLIKAITHKPDKALLVFVDDLDRCSPRHVASVVEAINQIFNSAGDRRCAFILGMDRDVVVASIEHEYRYVIEQLRHINPVLAKYFGENFLGKIVQATIQIPPPGIPALAGLLGTITGNAPPEEIAGVEKPIDARQVEKAVQAIRQAELKNPADAEKQRAQVEKSLPDLRGVDIDEAVRQVRADLLTSDSNDVAMAEFAILKYLPPNPRTLKRFDNLFRLQLHVTNNTPGCRISFHYEEIEAMARWVALRFRWPDLAMLIDKNPTVLENLDRSFNEKLAPLPEIQPWIDDEYLRGLLTVQQKSARISALPYETFLRVT